MRRRTHIQRRPQCRRTGKRAYPTREEAERSGLVLIMLGKWIGKKAYAYRCGDCGKWHITKMQQPDSEDT